MGVSMFAASCPKLLRSSSAFVGARTSNGQHCRFQLNGYVMLNTTAACRMPPVDQSEVDRFNGYAQQWWNDVVLPLHAMNTLRVPYIRDALVHQRAALEGKPVEFSTTPLTGLKVLDVGCGGGIVSEPLARLGAEVTGIDAASELIAVASRHAQLDPTITPLLNYRCATVEDVECEKRHFFDGVIASEIIDLVPDQADFVNACCSLVKPGGSIFFSTFNQTYLSYLLGIVFAERILRIVPVGTHEWKKFVKPKFLEGLLLQNEFCVKSLRGMWFIPVTMRWKWISDVIVCYAMHAVKLLDRHQTEPDSSSHNNWNLLNSPSSTDSP